MQVPQTPCEQDQGTGDVVLAEHVEELPVGGDLEGPAAAAEDDLERAAVGEVDDAGGEGLPVQGVDRVLQARGLGAEGVHEAGRAADVDARSRRPSGRRRARARTPRPGVCTVIADGERQRGEFGAERH